MGAGTSRWKARSTARRLDFLVDTGASVVALRERDAPPGSASTPSQRDYTASRSRPRTAPSRPRQVQINSLRKSAVSAFTACALHGAPGRGAVGQPARDVVPVQGPALRDGPTAVLSWSSKVWSSRFWGGNASGTIIRLKILSTDCPSALSPRGAGRLSPSRIECSPSRNLH